MWLASLELWNLWSNLLQLIPTTNTALVHTLFLKVKRNNHLSHGKILLWPILAISLTFLCRFVHHHHHHHHHQSLNREGCWGTTDEFLTSFLHFFLFSTALWDLPNSIPVHSLMLSSHLFLCPPCLAMKTYTSKSRTASARLEQHDWC